MIKMQNPFKFMRWDKEEKENLLFVLGAMGAGAVVVLGFGLFCMIPMFQRFC